MTSPILLPLIRSDTFLEQMGKKKKEIIQLDRESVIPIIKPKLIEVLSEQIDNKSEKDEFTTFCKRVEYTIRAWYLLKFEEMLQLHTLFDPVLGDLKLQERNLSVEEIDELEQKFLEHLFEMMNKSNFKIVSDREVEVAISGKYCLNLPIKVNEAKLDSLLLRRYFAKHPRDNLPYFADQYIIFRRGFGLNQMTAYFIQWKIDTIVSRIWKGFLRITGLRRFFSKKRRLRYVNKGQKEGAVLDADNDEDDDADVDDDGDEHDLYIERIRIQNMTLSFGKLISETTIQEPTFERMIILYRLRSSQENGSKEDGRGIHVKHFKNIPMADMEIVLPEKQNPGLTPLDWVKFIISAVIGLVTVITQVLKTKPDIKVIATVCSAVVGYIAKTYFTFQSNLKDYQNLITESMYDKQLDSGRGTLLHLCDDVILQEVKEVIVAFFVLMKYGKFTTQDLDRRCEELIKEQFGENCNFDVDDAIHKLERLGIVHKNEEGQYTCADVKQANDIIGTTTEEVVTNASRGAR